MKLPRKNFMYDLTQRSLVIGLLGTMLYSASVWLFKSYELMYRVNPMKNEIIKLIKEQEMIDAQEIKERELMEEQRGTR